MSGIETWERAAKADRYYGHAGVPDHRRSGGLAASTPSARMGELTQTLERYRQYLEEACHEVRRLEKAETALQRFRRIGNVSFGGVAVAQIWADFVLWEAVLNENPELRSIVEIGTWKGGFSLWLRAQAEARGMGFTTLDAVDHHPDREVPGFHRVDVFAKEPEVGSLLAGGPVILFCDGGNKPRELRTFPKYFDHPRSLVVVHDWGTETQPSDVPPDLEMVYGDFCEGLGSISRVFRVRG